MPRIAFACLCAAALAVLPACGSAGQEVTAGSAASTESSSTDSATSESSSESDSASASDTTPPPETGGTEAARSPRSEQPSLKVASLPIGANADGDGCLTIRFLRAASEVPAGMRLVVTRVWFEPEVIQFGGSACPQATPVCRPGLVLTETTRDECFASITTGDAAVGSRVEVQVKATVDCVGGQLAACVRFKEKIESDENSEGIATFSVPEPNEPETTPTVEPPSPSESESESAGSSESPTTASS